MQLAAEAVGRHVVAPDTKTCEKRKSPRTAKRENRVYAFTCKKIADLFLV
jgi:hypothetical protein